MINRNRTILLCASGAAIAVVVVTGLAAIAERRAAQRRAWTSRSLAHDIRLTALERIIVTLVDEKRQPHATARSRANRGPFGLGHVRLWVREALASARNRADDEVGLNVPSDVAVSPTFRSQMGLTGDRQQNFHRRLEALEQRIASAEQQPASTRRA